MYQGRGINHNKIDFIYGGGDMCCLSSSGTENKINIITETVIRRLTPTECERLQGFPDGWTEYGIDENGEKIKISDTQRYKTLGNAVSVPVVKAVAEKFKVITEIER